MPSNDQLPKQPLRNLVEIIFSGRFNEIPKILRRRLLNLLKFLRRIFWRIFGIAYDHPSVQKRRYQKQLRRILKKYYDYDIEKELTGKIKVALVLRDGTTYPKSSAFIRLISPLTDWSIKDKVSIKLFPHNTTQIPDNFQICIVQRTAFDDTNTAQLLLDNLKSQNIKLVIDNDDAFNIIDPTHPEHQEHKSRVDALNLLAGAADQVWLSVPKLRSYLPKLKQSAVITPNSLDSRLWQRDRSIKADHKALQLLYMGTVSHDADLRMIMPALEAVARTHPQSFELTVIGVASNLPDHPWIKRLHQKRGSSIYPKFVGWFINQGPFDIGLSPLVDSEFNNAKSDIKCLDYLAAGIVPIVSDIEPYQPAELDDYIVRIKNNPVDWQKKLTEFASDPERFRQYQAQILPNAQQYVWQKRSSQITAKELLKRLESLI